MNDQSSESNVPLNGYFFKIGMNILGLKGKICVDSKLEYYKYNFKYGPSRCAYIYSLIRNSILLPQGFEPKHVLWALHFLYTYGTERHMCLFLKADRTTIRKFTWPTIAAIAALEFRFVSIRVSCLHEQKMSYWLYPVFLKIRWENRFLGDDGKPAKVTVNGTDFETVAVTRGWLYEFARGSR